MKKIIVGRNGSGKTTYIERESNRHGSMLVNAKSMLPGESLFSKLTIEEVICTSNNKNYRENILSLLKWFSMDHLLKNKIGFLSGGEIKIFNIAFLLGSSPNILYFDEPERDLSERNIKLFIKLINKLDKDFVIVTHNMETLKGIRNKEVYEMENYELKKTTEKEWIKNEENN